MAALALTGCTVTESLVMGTDGSSSNTDISVEQFFVDVLADYSEFMPASDESIMDAAVSSFSKQLDDTGLVSQVVSTKDGVNEYTVNFNYDDLEELANALGGQKQSIIRQDGSSFSFYVDIDNYTELERIVPFLGDPNVAVYLANYNVGYSEQDYMDMITFAIGEEAPDALRDSLITFSIQVPGRITSLTGGVQTGEDSFTYSFPLIDFLLLAEPLSFSVTWQV